ncbi:MAG: hypothetical protein EHM79_07005 [Geobacter sp.]|nr:MAG: hypothetical protein EHM79_07005 [Geobacter sp.]
MGIVHEKYQQLKPEFCYLCDEVVLAQAWKKSHSYIRSHNWYADTLELDCSAVNLERRIKEWAEQLHNQTYNPSDIRLVPAPKADHWIFYQANEDWKWGPKPDEKTASEPISKCKELRPLAHLSIQDQTVATAIMLCLADAVETEQGSTDPEKNHKIWSYGNRLFCDWEGNRARFRWGNSSIYSKYFQDYQRFLERPIRKAQEAQKILPLNNGIYEIHLDLSAFYDSVSRKLLVRKLKRIAKKHYETNPAQSTLFWQEVENAIEGWVLCEDDRKLDFCLKNDVLIDDQGIPQGLVASGFFANAYLINLDRRLSKYIDKKLGDVTLIDFCRYVDDIRLLVHMPIELEPTLDKWVLEHIRPIIEKTKGLALNTEKTKVERYTAKRSGVSVRMKAIQKSASGPQDMMALDEMQSSLEGLIAIAEQFRDRTDIPYRECNLTLARIDLPQMDVREDTLLRFSINRLTKALQEKRCLTANNSEDKENVSELDHIYESFARRFVAVWARNPSLVSILKKGIQLFPHPQLLRPVIDALKKKLPPSKQPPLHNHDHDHERLIAFYCYAEIFRFAVLILHQQKPEERPQHSDMEGLRNLLVKTARELMEDRNIPWYVGQQIALFMAVNAEPLQISEIAGLEDYRLLFRILQGDRRFGSKEAIEKRLPLFVIAYQISQNPQQIVALLSDWLEWLYHKEQRRVAATILESVALDHAQLFALLLLHGQQIQTVWQRMGEKIARDFGVDQQPLPGNLSDYDDQFVCLARIVKREDNPFAQENAFLALALTTLDTHELLVDNKQLCPHHVEVKCKRWDKIQNAGNPKDFLYLRWVEKISGDTRYEPPKSWLSQDDDSHQLYRLGSFMRSCAIGNMDFTVGQHLMREETSHAYFGLRSSWYKRRGGMSHQPEAMNGDVAAMTSWVSELLYRLLQWPGLEFKNLIGDWPEKLTRNHLRMLLAGRLQGQEKLFGKASNLPVYIERIQHEVKGEKLLRVVMVQSLLPEKEDFTKEGAQLDAPTYRSKHRGHIATMARLVCEKLVAAQQVLEVQTVKPLADLIIFPELAVHEKDIDLLQRLADKTGAMIFTGLVFQKINNNLVNTGLWLIPYKNGHGRQWITRRQGKHHMTAGELALGIKPWRPYQLIIELANTLVGQPHGFRISGAICYDATDISLAADLKKVTNSFVISALNQDIDTFDTMVDALHYHMYQPVILVNTGQYGGSAAKAPYKEKYHKLIAHVHGNHQVAISMFELNIYDFGMELPMLGSGKEKKTKPAGLI